MAYQMRECPMETYEDMFEWWQSEACNIAREHDRVARQRDDLGEALKRAMEAWGRRGQERDEARLQRDELLKAINHARRAMTIINMEDSIRNLLKTADRIGKEGE